MFQCIVTNDILDVNNFSCFSQRHADDGEESGEEYEEVQCYIYQINNIESFYILHCCSYFSQFPMFHTMMSFKFTQYLLSI